ncbi:hypothetical protein [Arachidicoccus terrestris]|uniref:hypothetical protein n=1 Tax=Arachidicoccus terrestris TaxID=2875539 RepID=UPI001CC725B5|nr:hypothetical protein [Arachidicoccus terrestris]UAY55763.1 hypothetical protein K9M52_01635 [Arachidicoccus terrestris]
MGLITWKIYFELLALLIIVYYLAIYLLFFKKWRGIKRHNTEHDLTIEEPEGTKSALPDIDVPGSYSKLTRDFPDQTP